MIPSLSNLSSKKRPLGSADSFASLPGAHSDQQFIPAIQNQIKSPRLSDSGRRQSSLLQTTPYGVIPSVQHSPGTKGDSSQTPQAFDKNGDLLYPLFNVDSGIGGLIYMFDTQREIGPDLIQISQKYKVQFTNTHIGAANWAPFGNKSFDEIQSHTLSLLEETGRRHSRITTIACNTASTTMNKMAVLWTKEFISGVSVIPIITPTAKILYEEAHFLPNARGGLEKHIGVLSTQATMRTQQYHAELAIQHATSFGKTAITIIIYPPHLPEFPDGPTTWVKVYRGRTAISAGSIEERKLLSHMAHDGSVPTLYIYPYGPKNWVSIMEGKLLKNLTEEVTTDMDIYIQQVGRNKSKLSVVGTCCTHYPGVIPTIRKVFDNEKCRGVKIVSQGARIGRDVVLKMIQWDVQEGRFQKRDLETEMTIPLASYTAIDDIHTATISPFQDHPSLLPVKTIANTIYPDLAQLTRFFAIRPLPAPSGAQGPPPTEN